ncbi:triple tyrosine motif-containing protein [Riemerella anatipestifer]|nr:triple tyrosine motif-containing protein [Riemerella anatipestifer]MDY3493320.1 triple tyrosine motif-containing protein [Riemerella anatipestifer]
MLNDKYGFYPINNGFVLENKLQKANLVHYPLQFREARAFNNDETIRIAPQSEVAYHLNNVKFTYLVPNADVVSYQYFLEGFSEQWSDWSPKSQTDFINLREGNYILKVRTKQNNQISEVYTFAFRIQSPWYRSWWAYLCYIIVLLGGVFFIKRYQTNRLRKQRLELLKKEQNSLREQAEKHRQELVLHKKNQLEKEKELLLEKVKEKTIELANKAKGDDDKMRLLGAIKEKIETIQNNPNLSNRLLKEVRRDLETYLNTEDNTFEIQMDELHQEFFRAMKAKFPNLSIYDLRLCAYLKIGLTSKEMSDILQVLPSSINVSRSRLRKKLGLKPDEDLYEFLNKI